MKLITVDQYGAVLLRPQIAAEIADFERQIKHIEKRQKELKAAIKAEMEAKGIIKIDTPELTITYKAGYDRETFDSKQFKKDDPDKYDEYVRLSPVKSSVLIKVKDDVRTD